MLISLQLGQHRSGPFSHLRLHTVKFRHQDTRSHPRVEVPLELQKLAHEVKIGGHHRTTAPHVFIGICHCHEGVLHKIGDDDGRRTGHACLAVHQHTPSTLICLLWGENDRTVEFSRHKKHNTASPTFPNWLLYIYNVQYVGFSSIWWV